MSSEAAAVVPRELVIERDLDAPRDLVWKTWSEADHLARWWGPKSFKNGVVRLDFRPGGEFVYSMQPPGGDTWWGKFVYREIVPPERLVFVVSFAEPDGRAVRNPFGGTWATYPIEVLNTVTLEARGDRTHLVFRSRPINASAEEIATFEAVMGSVEEGTGFTLDALEAYLDEVETDRDLVQIREFDAPRDLVFEAWSRPEHVDRWMGPRGFTATTTSMDFRPGGVWRYVMRHADYGAFENVVTYRDLVRPDRLAFFHGSPEDPEMMDVTVRLTDVGGRTRLTQRSRFRSAEARAEKIRNVNAVEGGKQTFDRLADYLATL